MPVKYQTFLPTRTTSFNVARNVTASDKDPTLTYDLWSVPFSQIKYTALADTNTTIPFSKGVNNAPL